MNAATLPARSVSNLTPDEDTPVGDNPSYVDMVNIGDLEEAEIDSLPTDDLQQMGWAQPTFTRRPDGTIEMHEPNL